MGVTTRTLVGAERGACAYSRGIKAQSFDTKSKKMPDVARVVSSSMRGRNFGRRISGGPGFATRSCNFFSWRWRTKLRSFLSKK